MVVPIKLPNYGFGQLTNYH